MTILSSPISVPIRSISLSSRLNPHSIKIEDQIYRLKTWELSVVSASVDSITTGLIELAELYNCLDELVHSPLTQQALVQYQNGKMIEESLEGSIGLLDLSTMARDLSSMLKDNVRNIQMVLRRKGESLSIDSDINEYMSCKKKMKKESAKGLRALKKMENTVRSTALFDVKPYLTMVIRVLREVASITISILRFIFLFLSGNVRNTKPSRLSLISNIVLKSSSKTKKTFNEVQNLDIAIERSRLQVNDETTRKILAALDHGLEGLENGLDCLFRGLIKNRVSLLNILIR